MDGGRHIDSFVNRELYRYVLVTGFSVFSAGETSELLLAQKSSFAISFIIQVLTQKQAVQRPSQIWNSIMLSSTSERIYLPVKVCE